MQAHRPRSLDASSVDRLFVGVVVGRVDRLGRSISDSSTVDRGFSNGRNRSKIGPGTLWGHPVAPQSVPKVSMERLRGVSGRPRYASRASEESPTALQDAKKGRPQTSGNAPRRPKSTGSRAQERKSRAFYAKLVREARLKQFCVDFLRCLALSRNSKTLFRTAPAGKNKGLAHRAARRLGRTMRPRKTSKIDPKIDPKSSRIRCKVDRSG